MTSVWPILARAIDALASTKSPVTIACNRRRRDMGGVGVRWTDEEGKEGVGKEGVE